VTTRLPDFRRQNGEVLLLLDSASPPLVGQLVADSSTAHAFFDPIGRIPLLCVEFLHALLGQFGILNLLDALVADLGQPALEGSALGLGIDWMMRKALSVLTTSVM
jgi:hypothetical protein